MLNNIYCSTSLKYFFFSFLIINDVTYFSTMKKSLSCFLWKGGALDGSDVFIGAKADDHRGALLLSHPIEHGTYTHVLLRERNI